MFPPMTVPVRLSTEAGGNVGSRMRWMGSAAAAGGGYHGPTCAGIVGIKDSGAEGPTAVNGAMETTRPGAQPEGVVPIGGGGHGPDHALPVGSGDTVRQLRPKLASVGCLVQGPLLSKGSIDNGRVRLGPQPGGGAQLAARCCAPANSRRRCCCGTAYLVALHQPFDYLRTSGR